MSMPEHQLPSRPAAAFSWPQRNDIRGWLASRQVSRNGYALGLLTADLAGFLACLWLACTADWLLVQGLAALVQGVFITRLFIIGHDACHGSLTSSRRLNKILGRIAFATPLVPYQYWEISHNILHHTYNNLKGKDKVWEPYSKAEFDALPRHRQWLERLYRGPLGAGPYYLWEMWWKILYRPKTKNRKARFDKALTTLVMLLWVGAIVAFSLQGEGSVALNLLFGFVLPFVVWGYCMSFFVYVHHTHPSVIWYDKEDEWKQASTYVSATVHIIFPWFLGRVFHNIMEHPAHHANMAIPCYEIRRAQATLEERIPGKILIQKFSLRFYLDTLRRCKLYDYQAKAWLDFAGNRTD